MKSRRSSSTQPQRRGASSFLSAAGLPPWRVTSPPAVFRKTKLSRFCSGRSRLISIVSLPCLCTLAVSLFGINIGPMRKAEERAEKTGALDNPGRGGTLTEETMSPSKAKPRVLNMLLPMGYLSPRFLPCLPSPARETPQGAGMQKPPLGLYSRCCDDMYSVCSPKAVFCG